ncbi:MAG: flippase-like domain-containing protein [Lewinellaceae bacterium]|nr:flippase-like domain-containing protein [Saprospiraceae bacterium]MCB9355852.1 flippase-like domain-containing protein [Lewinellaceae bacterium]
MSIKTALKVGLSILIVYIVLRSIDTGLLYATLQEANPWWLLWALLWFVCSKLIAAQRLLLLLRTENIPLSAPQNFRLYWLGMYYNLLLPGGISGDGYKIKILMDSFGASFKRMFAITLLDRLGGVVALGQLCLALAPGIPALRPYWYLYMPALIMSIPASWWLYRRLGGSLTKVWGRTSLLSLGVQASQLIATLGIVLALSESALWLEYSLLFLISSVVAMLPLTIGGTGARELTFLWGAGLLKIDPEKSVAIAFLFYLISTAVSFAGIVYSLNPGKMGLPERQKPVSRQPDPGTSP